MKFFVPAMVVCALATSAVAQEATEETRNEVSREPAGTTAESNPDQNRTICKTQKVSGTRLSSKKICMTAAQWEQEKRDQRQATERTQAGRWKSE